MNLPAKHQIEAEFCRRSFAFFVKTFWHTIIPDPLVWNWHMEYLCDELQKVGMRVRDRKESEADLLINIPPGSSKSTIVSQMFPVWCWVIDDTIKLITASYSKSLSIRDAVKSRDIIRSDLFRLYFPDMLIKEDSDSKAMYETRNAGKRMATSVGGGIVGEHAHILIGDDMLNPKKEPTERQLNTANDFVDYLRTTRRINSKISVFILVMQRLHELDPAGHLLNKKDIRLKHICLPARLSPNVKPIELRDKYLGGLLDPVRLDEKDLADKLVGLGSYGFAGQYGQDPAPSGGGIIKKDWFLKISMDQLRTKAKQAEERLVWKFTIDGAYTSDPNNAQTAILCYAMLGNNMYIRKVLGVWEEMPDFIKTCYRFVTSNGYNNNSSIYVEPKATGLPIVHTMKRETDLNMIIDKAPTQDKISRTRAAAPFIESGRVYLITDEPDWIESFVMQC